MARLTPQVRVFITQKLACFESPSLVVRAVKHQFGMVVSKQAVEAHDPTKYAGRSLGRKYKGIFEQTRAAYFRATAEVAISHKSVRLRKLQNMLEKAEADGNLMLCAQLLEQAAKEAGGAYTNHRIYERGRKR